MEKIYCCIPLHFLLISCDRDGENSDDIDCWLVVESATVSTSEKTRSHMRVKTFLLISHTKGL